MRKRKYTKELLENLAKDSVGITDLLNKLGLSCSGGSYRSITNYLREYNINPIWLNAGQNWSKGLTVLDPRIEKQAKSIRYPDDVLFSKNAPTVSGSRLMKRLKQLGWKHKCIVCNLCEWNNKSIPLDVDHINGIPNDNRLENLRFLCPNCHRQTDTWGNKKRMPT